MSSVGIELTPELVRAVSRSRWRGSHQRTLEVRWDPAQPEPTVAAFREALGPVGRIALSVSLGFLHVKRVNLPPVPPSDRKRMLALEPDRYFPVQGEPLAIALSAETDLAFAMDAALLERWIDAFTAWGPVEVAEPAPVSFARALAGRGADGTYRVAAGPGELGVVELRGGRVDSARRLPGPSDIPGLLPLPDLAGVSAEFLAASGVVGAFGAPFSEMLTTERVADGIHARRVTSALLASAACAAALVFALWSLDGSRERTLRETRAAAAAIEPRAADAVELQNELTSIRTEMAQIQQLGGTATTDALGVLAALSERLPPGAAVASLALQADEWRVEGTAADASQIVPLLDADDRFQDVRILSASTRFRDGARTSETFSVAFRARPAS
jgi:hypothetical protein